MVAAEYQVRAITGNQFIVIYTRGSETVKAWLARFLRMFNSSTDEWVAGLDVEYTTVLGREKGLKYEERKKLLENVAENKNFPTRFTKII